MTTVADQALSEIHEILGRQYSQGTAVTNCVVHMSRPILDRPRNCELCQTDIRNVLSRALRANEWLNQWKDDMTKAYKKFAVNVLKEVKDAS